jgi:predicted TIM-barrel fold metal-dependent hydrolase
MYPISLFDARIRCLLDRVADRHGIVLIDLGARRVAFDELGTIAASYPTANFILPHLPPPLEIAIELAAVHANIYLDTSSPQVRTRHVERALQRVGADKLIFGSDAPREIAGEMRYSIDVIDRLKVGDHEKDAIYSGNITRLLARALSAAQFEALASGG